MTNGKPLAFFENQLERLYGDAVDSGARQALCEQAMKYLE